MPRRERLSDELERLVGEVSAEGDDDTGAAEAWALIADSVVANIDTIVAALRAAGDPYTKESRS